LIIPVLFQPAIKDKKSDQCSSPGSSCLDPPLHVKKLNVGKDKQTRGAVIDIVTGKGRLMEIDRPRQKLYPLEINCNYEEEKSKDGRIATLDRPRRSAAIDADWRHRILDQMD